MTAAAIHFEVKKHAVRQTADGWVISFVVHPNDMTPAFAVAPLGTRYMLAVAQIGDDEQPISARADDGPERPPAGTLGGADPAEGRPLSDRSERARMAYANGTPGEQAVVRAVLLSKDPRFQAWVHPSCRGMPNGVATVIAKDHIKTVCGGLSSRSEIANPDALDRFLKMETEYLQQSGGMLHHEDAKNLQNMWRR